MTWTAPRLAGAALILLAGCGARGEPAPGAVPEVAQTVPQPADTLVLSLPGGNSVWLAEGRPAKDSAGTPCFERSVEIRRDSIKLKVPLLFTGAIPNPDRRHHLHGRLVPELPAALGLQGRRAGRHAA